MSLSVHCKEAPVMPTRSIAPLLLLLFGAGAAADTLGTITASIDGGAEKTWYVTAIDGETQSSWIQVMPGSMNMASVSLWGNPAEDQVGALSDALLLSVALVRQPGGMTRPGYGAISRDRISRLLVHRGERCQRHNRRTVCRWGSADHLGILRGRGKLAQGCLWRTGGPASDEGNRRHFRSNRAQIDCER